MRKKIKKYFIPNKDNDHQPHFLRNKFAFLFLSLVLFVEIIGVLLFSTDLGLKLNNLSAVLPSVLVSKANEERLDIGENELAINEKLVLAAQLKANDMAEKSYFAHTSPEGKDPWFWLNLSGYKYEFAGENLAVNFVDSSDVHRAWMNSPTHRQNIIRDGFTEIGIATAEGFYKGEKVIFVAQFFGKPKINNIPVVVNSENLETPISETEDIAVSEDIKETAVLGAEIVQENEAILDVNSDENNVISDTNNTNLEVNDINSDTNSVNSDISLDYSNLEIKEPTFFEELISSPKKLLLYILSALGFIVLFALFLKVFVKIKIQYPKLILNGVLLLVIIMCLIYINHFISIKDLEIS